MTQLEKLIADLEEIAAEPARYLVPLVARAELALIGLIRRVAAA